MMKLSTISVKYSFKILTTMYGYTAELSVKMDEELIIHKTPYLGLNIFDSSKCLTYFSKETILEDLMGVSTLDPVDERLYSMAHLLVSEPVKLFFLTSVGAEGVIDVCYECLRRSEPFTLSDYDVIRVFLNWGASLKSLGVEEDERFSSVYPSSQTPVSLPNLPAPIHVKTVLDTLSNSLSDKEGVEADKQRYTLVKVLMTASLDERMRQHKSIFHQTIARVLQSFPVWTLDKVVAMVVSLNLLQLGLSNATYVCISLPSVCPRINDFKLVAVQHLLNSKFGLPPPVESIYSLKDNLPPTKNITERFQISDTYALIHLLITLLTTFSRRPTRPTEEIEKSSFLALIRKVKDWSEYVHNEHKTPDYLHTIEGSLIRGKCGHLKGHCVEIVKRLGLIDNWENDDL